MATACASLFDDRAKIGACGSPAAGQHVAVRVEHDHAAVVHGLDETGADDVREGGSGMRRTVRDSTAVAGVGRRVATPTSSRASLAATTRSRPAALAR